MEAVKKIFVRELLEKIDILEVVSEYISVKKIGKDWYAVCPFHPDTKPSLRIREDKKIFNCFGCGVGGNVITFISKIRNISFLEALSFLAERYYPDIYVEINKEAYSQKRKIIQVNAHILMLLRKYLKNKDGKLARDYLNSRQVKEEMWDIFALGFAPADPYLIPNILLKEGFSQDELCSTGNIKHTGDSLMFIFRNKIMFPINNPKGEIIAFGGRTLDETIQPKYINSAESSVFKKRESFFGIMQALDEMRLYGKCVIVEGYFDVISMHQAGLKNTISCLGTALTPSHVGFLKRLVSDVVIIFDGDDAGRKAALKNIDLFLKSGIIPKVGILPYGEDPDSFVRKGGTMEDVSVKDGVIFAAETFLDEPIRKKDTVGISRAISQVHLLLSLVYNESETQAEIYVREISEKLGISPSVLKSDVRKLARPYQQPSRKRADIPEYELEILRFAIFKKESLKYISEYEQYISSEEVVSALRCVREADGNVELAISLADEKVKKLILEVVIEGKDYPEIGWEELLESILKRLAIEKIRKELIQISKEAYRDPIKRQRYFALVKKLSFLEGVKPKTKRGEDSGSEK
ncbi:MAG: DNA primase [Candidatus Calescibacterium sp.]|nr:DNA primase [Candidatus Calescibacterium sp.]